MSEIAWQSMWLVVGFLTLFAAVGLFSWYGIKRLGPEGD